MTWYPYNGEQYIDFPATEKWCRDLVEAHPSWFSIEEIGRTRHDRPILLITVGEQSSDVHRRPALWLDGGTHASEWTGVMAALHTMSRWAERLSAGDPETISRFQRNTAYVAPCISPDGFQAICDGAPFLRSSLRPSKAGKVHRHRSLEIHRD